MSNHTNNTHLTVYPDDPIGELAPIRAGLQTIAAALLANQSAIPCDTHDIAESVLVFRDRLVDVEEKLREREESGRLMPGEPQGADIQGLPQDLREELKHKIFSVRGWNPASLADWLNSQLESRGLARGISEGEVCQFSNDIQVVRRTLDEL